MPNGDPGGRGMMGTVLYADYRGDGISRVLLPSGESGWISDDGLVILPPDGTVEPVADGARYFTTTALTFLNVTTLDHGVTIYGASIPGIVYVSAAVNGLEVPRQMSDQIQSGQTVNLKRVAETGLVDTRILKPGDILFFSRAGSLSDLDQMAICITPNSLLVENQGRSSIRLLDPTKRRNHVETLVAVRRLFQKQLLLRYQKNPTKTRQEPRRLVNQKKETPPSREAFGCSAAILPVKRQTTVDNAAQALLTALDRRHLVQTCRVLGVPLTSTRTLWTLGFCFASARRETCERVMLIFLPKRISFEQTSHLGILYTSCTFSCKTRKQDDSI